MAVIFQPLKQSARAPEGFVVLGVILQNLPWTLWVLRVAQDTFAEVEILPVMQPLVNHPSARKWIPLDIGRNLVPRRDVEEFLIVNS